jgi:hypothetical protein
MTTPIRTIAEAWKVYEGFAEGKISPERLPEIRDAFFHGAAVVLRLLAEGEERSDYLGALSALARELMTLAHGEEA